MKSAKRLIIAGSASLLALACIPVSISLLKANDTVPAQFSSEITPTKPGKGETVSFFPKAMTEFYQLSNLVGTYKEKNNLISELMPDSQASESWTNYINNPGNYATAVEYFDKYDANHPTNNILAWNSTINASEYKIIISQDSKLKTIEREYTVSGDQNSVKFDNPYTGVKYYWQVIATKNDSSKVYSDIFNFNVADLPRTVYIPGISNTRDFGGSTNMNGEKIKEGLIYRGSLLELTTEAGKREISNLGIKTDLSLRGIGEGGDNPLSLTNFHLCPAPYDVVFDANKVPVDSDSNMANVSGSKSNCANLGQAIKVLANKDNYPLIFHCAVGRDRTGLFGICLDFLCGMSEETTLKEFLLSLFSCSGATKKGETAFYDRFIRIRDYLNTFEGDNFSEKTENYLVTCCEATSEDCQKVRDILLGKTDTGFVPGTINENSYENYSKVTFRQYGQTSIIKLVRNGEKIANPNISGNGSWYSGDQLFDFNTPITEDINLDYIVPSNNKVVLHYIGIDKDDDVLDLEDGETIDFTNSKFAIENYSYKAYDSNFIEVESSTINGDTIFNLVYKTTVTFTPKPNSRVIVMAGQSNAAGVGHYPYLVDSLPEEKIQQINHGYDNVLMRGYSHRDIPEFRPVYADEEYNTCTSPGTFGFEVSLADRLSKIYPDETIYIVKYALGASNLGYDWCPPSSRETTKATSGASGGALGCLYDGMVETVHESLDWIKENTNTYPVLDAFMWMQGESGSLTYANTDSYIGLWDNFVKDFKEEFKNDFGHKFAFYDAGISEHETWPLASEVNQIKRDHISDDYVYVDTNGRGLTTQYEPFNDADKAHYDAGCYFDLGHLFADCYVKHNDYTYQPDKLEVIVPERKVLSINDNNVSIEQVTKFNGSVVSGDVLYRSRNENILTIDENGLITPKSEGSTFVKVQVYYDGEVTTKEVPVRIFGKNLENVELLSLKDESKIHYNGRNIISDDKVTFINTLSGFETTFVGKELKAKMIGTKGDQYYIPCPQTLKLRVYVDDDKVGKLVNVKLTSSATANIVHEEVILATFDEVGTHKVKVEKVNYERRGYIEMTDLYGPTEFLETVDTRKKVLILGDSITVGCGINGKGNLDTYENEDGTLTYAAQFVHENNLNAQVICVTGISLGAPVYWRKTMADIYKQYAYSYAHEYDFSSFVPDLVLINLGTNDAGALMTQPNQYGDYRTADDVFDGAMTILKGLRTYYDQNTSILFSMGMMGYDNVVASNINRAITQYSLLETNKFAPYQGFMKYNFSQVSSSYGGHPTPECHAKAAEQLQNNELIISALGL